MDKIQKENSNPETKKANFEKYVDPTGEFTNRELKWGAWYLKHKIAIRKATIIFLIVWCVIFGGYSIIAWGSYLIFGYTQDQRMHARQIAEFQDFRSIQGLYGAQPLQVETVDIFPGMSNRYDFVAMVQNPNPRWTATLSYQFTYDGGQTAVETAGILPGQTTPVGILGHKLENFPGSARFEIVDVVWRRLDSRDVPDVNGLIGSRLQFSIDNLSISPPELGEDGLPAYRLMFDIYNDSAYSYWMGDFILDLFGQGRRVGVVKLSIPRFLAGTSQQVDMRIVRDGIVFDDIRLNPVINIFDDDVYIAPGD